MCLSGTFSETMLKACSASVSDYIGSASFANCCAEQAATADCVSTTPEISEPFRLLQMNCTCSNGVKVRIRGLLQAYKPHSSLLDNRWSIRPTTSSNTRYADTALRSSRSGTWLLAFTCHVCTTCCCCAVLHKGGAAAPRPASAMCFHFVVHSICACFLASFGSIVPACMLRKGQTA